MSSHEITPEKRPPPSPIPSNLQLPSPIITKRTRTASTSARAMENPIEKGLVKSFSRSKGHGFITPHGGGDDLFVIFQSKLQGVL
uniref:CSD domain-containing protein n=1 Tax=Megaselia scalaris TaxID=36166 RepID=T1GV91_MEGSC